MVNPLNLVLLGKCEQVLLLALGGKQLSYILLGKGEEGLMLAPGCRPADVLNAFFFSKCEKGMLLAPCDEPAMAVSFGKFG